MSFWWCLKHSSVEGSASESLGCANLERLGPYGTSEQAAAALDRAQARTAEQDAKDAADDDWGSA